MRLLLAAFFFFIFSAVSFAQKIFTPDKLKTKIITLEVVNENMSQNALPFNFIKIIDSRFDTTKIGFYKAGSYGKNAFKKLCFKASLTETLEKYFNDYYHTKDNSGEIGLLIVVRKFWVSGDMENPKEYADDFDFYLSWDTYISKANKYLPFKRIDTIINITKTNSRSFVKDSAENSNDLNLKTVLKNLLGLYDFSTPINVFDKRQTKTLPEIETYNDKRLKLPILMQDTPAKGIYQNFSQFAQNKPGITSYTVQETRVGLLDKVKYLTDSSGNNIRHFWAFFDGKVLSKGHPDNIILFKTGNRLEYFRVEEHTRGSIPSGDPSGTGTYNFSRLVWEPFQIDMDTGKAY